MKPLVSVVLLLLSGVAHGQTNSEIQAAVFANHDKAMTIAFEKCKNFQGRTLAQPTDPTLTAFEQVAEKRDLIACVDANTASLLAFGDATSPPPYNNVLTLAQTFAITSYADSHFPEAFDAHTLAEWREAYQHRDDPAPESK